MSGLVNGLVGILFGMCVGTSGSVCVPLCQSQVDKVVRNSCLIIGMDVLGGILS